MDWADFLHEMQAAARAAKRSAETAYAFDAGSYTYEAMSDAQRTAQNVDRVVMILSEVS